MPYYRHTIRVDILTERPLKEWELDDLGTIDYETDQGEWVGHIEVTRCNDAVDADTMARLLVEAGSDPSFFGLDDRPDRVEP